LEMMELLDSFGSTTQLRFTQLQRNPVLDPSAFMFTPPKGVDVIGNAAVVKP
ncbi:MAG: outer membrane lipoprotein carrier protein LolA, partial [Gammaproteobacteria bacterium]